jgi:hypothetical protein
MRFTRRAAVLAVLPLAVALLVSVASADDVTTTAGKKINGKLISVDAKGVTFQANNATVPIAGREIVLVDHGNKLLPAPKETYSEIELTDGSTIRVAKFLLKGTKFEVEQLPGSTAKTAPTFTLPKSAVFSAMKKADDAKHRAAWTKMLATRGKRDLYVIQQEAGLNYVQGTILEGLEKDGAWRLSFEKESKKPDEQPETLLQSRAVGIVLYHAQPATLAPTICHVMDVFGNSLNATAITITPNGVTVTTVAGATVKYPSTAAITKLNYQLGNVAYISDLNPQVEGPEIPKEEKNLNPTAPFLKDRSLSNDNLKLENVVYPKGLCIAPDTVLTFNLNGGYSQFKGLAGIDENGANATSAAKLTVEADGQVLFTGTLTRKDKPKGLVLSVKGVKQLKVIVEAETPLNGNYLVLADARVQK